MILKVPNSVFSHFRILSSVPHPQFPWQTFPCLLPTIILHLRSCSIFGSGPSLLPTPALLYKLRLHWQSTTRPSHCIVLTILQVYTPIVLERSINHQLAKQTIQSVTASILSIQCKTMNKVISVEK